MARHETSMSKSMMGAARIPLRPFFHAWMLVHLEQVAVFPET
jgi:hypothetical protein